MTEAIQTDHEAQSQARCPRCANTQGIKDGGPTLQHFRAYDIANDCFGLLRCPHCGLKAGAAEFRTNTQSK